MLGVGDGGARARRAVLASSIAREGWRNSGARHEVRASSALSGTHCGRLKGDYGWKPGGTAPTVSLSPRSNLVLREYKTILIRYSVLSP